MQGCERFNCFKSRRFSHLATGMATELLVQVAAPGFVFPRSSDFALIIVIASPSAVFLQPLVCIFVRSHAILACEFGMLYGCFVTYQCLLRELEVSFRPAFDARILLHVARREACFLTCVAYFVLACRFRAVEDPWIEVVSML